MKKNILIVSATLLVGLFLGWLFFHSSTKTVKQEKEVTVNKPDIWTCSMHPQIKIDHAGKCPICAMDLIPLHNDAVLIDSLAVHFTNEAVELAHVQTSIVSRQQAEKEVRLYGKVQADERLQQSQVAHIAGRIEKLMVNFTGESVRKGQTLAIIYSPELSTAQQELLESAKSKQTDGSIYEAAKEKLRQLKLTEKQIDAIEKSGRIQTNFDIKATTNGIVVVRRVNTGDYVSQGAVLFDVADLSHLWLLFDAYESDLPFINKGSKISYTLQAIPGSSFSGNIAFIDPVVDPTTRISKIRVEVNNQSGKLKPEMFATGTLTSNLTEYRTKIILPRSAILWTGKRSVVYVKQSNTGEYIFNMREVELGPMLGNSYVIMSGLTEGEEVVTQGAFSVDAAAQLEGKPSMMNKMTSNKLVQQKEIQPKEIGKKETVSFHVSGNCDMCKERIETAAKSVKGVLKAVWNVDTKKIKIEYNSMETSIIDIQKVIAKAGHDTEKFKTDSKTYNALPACCLYRSK